MINFKKQSEGKQVIKAKVGHLIEQYERTKHQEQLHKQQLKQNIMMQLKNNRNKQISPQSNKQQAEIISQNSKDISADPQVFETTAYPIVPTIKANTVDIKSNIASNIYSLPQTSVQQIEDNLPQMQNFQQMTFNLKINNTKLSQYANMQDIKEIEQKGGAINLQNESLKKSINSLRKNLNGSGIPNQKSRQKIELNRRSNQKQQRRSPYKDSSYSNGNNQSINNASSVSKQSKSFLPQKGQQKVIQNNLVSRQQTFPPSVFLTMDQSQSMTGSDMPKNYAFEIKMETSIEPDEFQELKRQKIKEIQKKRQQRIEQFRKNQSQKKVDMPRGRNSIVKMKHPQKLEKQQLNQIQIPPKSIAIERKNNMQRPPKTDNKLQKDGYNKNQLIPLEYHQSSYQIKQKDIDKSSYMYNQNYMRPNNKNSNFPMQDANVKAVSPFRTPNTVVSEQRSKSRSKNTNIFAVQQPYQRQKSTNKLTEPKIEPKERKNSFSRQSNKKLMINAITHVIFPGQLNRKERQRLIQVLQTSEHQFFIFLFKEYSRKMIKGIYFLDNSQTRLERIYGDKAPLQITPDRVQEFYRFDSGSREFKKVDGCRSFSLAIHAIDLR